MWKRKPFGISVEVLSVLAGILLIVVVLWRPVFIGVADNGDFLRIMNTAGLQYYDASESYEDRFFSYSHERFAYDAPLRGFYPSSQVLVVWLARTIASIINGNYFNIRILGAIYTLLLLSALWLLVKYNKPQTPALGLAIGGVLLFVFFDMGYLAYFHSLYGEPVSMLGLLLAFALGLRLLRRSVPDRTGIVLLFLAVLFLILAKIQNAPLGLLFTLIFLRLAWLYKDTGLGAEYRKLCAPIWRQQGIDSLRWRIGYPFRTVRPGEAVSNPCGCGFCGIGGCAAEPAQRAGV